MVIWMKKLEEKVFRDPIYGYIHVYDQLIWDLIQTKEVFSPRAEHLWVIYTYLYYCAGAAAAAFASASTLSQSTPNFVATSFEISFTCVSSA